MNSVGTTEWFVIISTRDSLAILFCKVGERLGSHHFCEVQNLETRSAKFQPVIPDANRLNIGLLIFFPRPPSIRQIIPDPPLSCPK
jgi:hypothetical protein